MEIECMVPTLGGNGKPPPGSPFAPSKPERSPTPTPPSKEEKGK